MVADSPVAAAVFASIKFNVAVPASSCREASISFTARDSVICRAFINAAPLMAANIPTRERDPARFSTSAFSSRSDECGSSGGGALLLASSDAVGDGAASPSMSSLLHAVESPAPVDGDVAVNPTPAPGTTGVRAKDVACLALREGRRREPPDMAYSESFTVFSGGGGGPAARG